MHFRYDVRLRGLVMAPLLLEAFVPLSRFLPRRMVRAVVAAILTPCRVKYRFGERSAWIDSGFRYTVRLTDDGSLIVGGPDGA